MKENMSEPNGNHENILKTRWRPKQLIWRIQFDIVSIFIILICAFSLIISFYTYYTNSRELTDLSFLVTEQANTRITRTVGDITDQAALLAQVTKGLILNEKDVSGENQTLISYLLNLVSREFSITNVTVVSREGNLVSVINLIVSNQLYYHLDPSKELPSGSQYALRIVTRTGPNPSEVWEYKDNNMNTVATETIPGTYYDPRGETWYQKMAVWPHLHWQMMPSALSGQEIVSVTSPLVNPEEKVFAVVNVGLSLDQMSNVIALESIEKTGRAFVLNSDGEIIVPISQNITQQDVFPFVMKQAYEFFTKTNDSKFLITNENKKYLICITEFALEFNDRWLIAVVVPFDDFFAPIFRIQKQTIIISVAILIFFIFLINFASKHISTPIVKLAGVVNRIQNFDFQEPPKMKSRISEIIVLDSSIRSMGSALRSFSRYIPREIVKTLIKQGQEINIGGERRELTVLFSDIENFTTVAESFEIEELTQTLSEYFEAFSKIIVNSEGTIDKFIGDSIMAFWNAPGPVVDQGNKACLSALQCLKITNNPNEKNPFLKGRTRFGIHSGEAIVGNIGTSERMNYTAIGNVVNTAARLQTLNKIYNTSIIISEPVHEKIGTRFITRPLDFIVVKGRTKGITIFELVGLKEEGKELSATPAQVELCVSFTKAYELLLAGKVEEAIASFSALHEKFPSDTVTQLYLDRLHSEARKKIT